MHCVRDIMTADVVRLTPESTIREAMETLSTRHLSGAPVVEGDRVVGVISMSDLLGFIISAPAAGSSADSEESVADSWNGIETELDDDDELNAAALSDEVWEEWTDNTEARVDDAEPVGEGLLDQRTVEEAMNREVFSISPGSSIRRAAIAMHRRGIHRLIVMEGKTLVGIVSAFDIARVVGENGLSGKSSIHRELPAPDETAWITK